MADERSFLSPFRDLRRTLLRSKSLPPYTKQDVQAFIRSDPLQGARLEKMNRASNLCYAGAGIGGLSTAAICLRFSKNVPGAIAGAAFGAVVGLRLGEEVAHFALGLYEFPRLEPKNKFLDWWEQQQQL